MAQGGPRLDGVTPEIKWNCEFFHRSGRVYVLGSGASVFAGYSLANGLLGFMRASVASSPFVAHSYPTLSKTRATVLLITLRKTRSPKGHDLKTPCAMNLVWK